MPGKQSGDVAGSVEVEPHAQPHAYLALSAARAGQAGSSRQAPRAAPCCLRQLRQPGPGVLRQQGVAPAGGRPQVAHFSCRSPRVEHSPHPAAARCRPSSRAQDAGARCINPGGAESSQPCRLRTDAPAGQPTSHSTGTAAPAPSPLLNDQLKMADSRRSAARHTPPSAPAAAAGAASRAEASPCCSRPCR